MPGSDKTLYVSGHILRFRSRDLDTILGYIRNSSLLTRSRSTYLVEYKS